MPKLKRLEIKHGIKSKSERDQLRASAKKRKIELVLTGPDETSGSESDRSALEDDDEDDSSAFSL